jgi:hypothetical protein
MISQNYLSAPAHSAIFIPEPERSAGISCHHLKFNLLKVSWASNVTSTSRRAFGLLEEEEEEEVYYTDTVPQLEQSVSYV